VQNTTVNMPRVRVRVYTTGIRNNPVTGLKWDIAK